MEQIYSFEEFKQKFGQEIQPLKINGVINFSNIWVGSEFVFIDEPLKSEMEAGNQIDFNQCYIEVDDKYTNIHT